MQNIEFKAELRDPSLARAVCRSLGAQHHGERTQIDTYFRSADMRFKLRESPGHPDEFILYKRADRLRPKMSRYELFTREEAAERFGLQTLVPWLTVRKRRDLYVLDDVRIHLDDVEHIGNFLEFEALVSPQCNVAACHQKIARLRRDFDPTLGEAVSCGYVDLLSAVDGA